VWNPDPKTGKLIPAANNQITVSPLQQVDGKPVITILVPRGADSAYLYYLDMSEFKSLLEKKQKELDREQQSLQREGEQLDLYASPRALKDLGWAPRIPLEQSIRDTLDYWRDRAHMEVD